MWKWFKAHKRLLDFIWSNKQFVTGGVTTAVSGLATAKFISADLSVKVTTLTGVLVMLFAGIYSLFKAAAEQEPPQQ